ncbi:hypothetical protein GCM10010365_17360 [Streptomyces poonensis]|uniref:Uncharacterized protein n=1 Tax=Streptomyces poonensis TaxID=68255 RepID=A0A918UF06_9ACTN|nr:hypothetical protein GCM10010365_17360 [Streptomyces poonensis]
MGLADAAAQTVTAAVGGTVRGRPGDGRGALPDAALGLVLHLERRALAAVAAVDVRVLPRVRAVARGFVPAGVADLVEEHIALWSARGAAERLRAREELRGTARAVTRALTAAVLAEVDVDAVADRVDVERIARRVDVDAVLARVDLVTYTERVLGKLDLVAYTEAVLEELELGRIVRDTGGSIAGETLDAFRRQNVRADRLVQRLTDRVLRRGGPGGDALAPRVPVPQTSVPRPSVPQMSVPPVSVPPASAPPSESLASIPPAPPASAPPAPVPPTPVPSLSAPTASAPPTSPPSASVPWKEVDVPATAPTPPPTGPRP